MNVLRNNFELISGRVSTYELASALWDLGLLPWWQLQEISDRMTNKESLARLLDMIEGAENANECIYEIWSNIRSRYPNVSFHIRQIELGVRLRMPIGTKAEVVVTVSLYDEDLCVDIRRYHVS